MWEDGGRSDVTAPSWVLGGRRVGRSSDGVEHNKPDILMVEGKREGRGRPEICEEVEMQGSRGRGWFLLGHAMEAKGGGEA